MPKNDRRRELKEQMRLAAKQKLLDELPIKLEQVKALFDALDEQLGDAGCDHTLTRTRAFLTEIRKDDPKVYEWLKRHGGHCDCEVLANVEDAHLSILE